MLSHYLYQRLILFFLGILTAFLQLALVTIDAEKASYVLIFTASATLITLLDFGLYRRFGEIIRNAQLSDVPSKILIFQNFQCCFSLLLVFISVGFAFFVSARVFSIYSFDSMVFSISYSLCHIFSYLAGGFEPAFTAAKKYQRFFYIEIVRRMIIIGLFLFFIFGWFTLPAFIAAILSIGVVVFLLVSLNQFVWLRMADIGQFLKDEFTTLVGLGSNQALDAIYWSLPTYLTLFFMNDFARTAAEVNRFVFLANGLIRAFWDTWIGAGLAKYVKQRIASLLYKTSLLLWLIVVLIGIVFSDDLLGLLLRFNLTQEFIIPSILFGIGNFLWHGAGSLSQAAGEGFSIKLNFRLSVAQLFCVILLFVNLESFILAIQSMAVLYCIFALIFYLSLLADRRAFVRIYG